MHIQYHVFLLLLFLSFVIILYLASLLQEGSTLMNLVQLISKQGFLLCFSLLNSA